MPPATLDATLIGAAQALLLGLLLGLERERSRVEHHERFAGIRTFPLFALVGYFGAVLSPHAPWLLPVIVLVTGAFAVVSLLADPAGRGATTEAAVLVTVLLGAAVGLGLWPLAAAVAVAVALLLTLKAPLHRFARAISGEEILAILKFGVVAVIVLPLLPDRPMGPYQALNPRVVGLLVLLLTGVGLAGYLAVRLFGRGAGYALAGLLGGLVSSTAVTLSFSGKARELPSAARALAVGVVLASTILYARSVLVITALDPALGARLAPRLLALILVGAGFAGWLYHRERRGAQGAPHEMPLGNPVELGRALGLAGIFAATLLAARAAQTELGTAGLWSVSFVGGLVDVDSVAVAVARLREQGHVALDAAAGAYLLATASNLLLKGLVVALAGGRALTRQVLPAFLALAALTIALVLAG